jgi:ferredoxin-type protein NapH
MRSQRLRIIIPLLIILVVAIGYVTSVGIGTLSSFGWDTISVLCPLGALGTMLASKTVLPRAVISLILAVVLILIFGRAFCGWICPVPVVSKLRDLFAPEKKNGKSGKSSAASTAVGKANAGTSGSGTAVAEARADSASTTAAVAGDDIPTELTDEEKALLASCKSPCHAKREPVDSRHFVLGGALLSTFIFGFPVFCLICPIGLTFGTVLLVMRLFGMGDVTWATIIVPLLLLVEIVFFRKWCSTFCPLSALMSLVGKGNRTLRPHSDTSLCLETTKGARCGKCVEACPEGIDPHHPELGASLSECTRCRACVDACPSGAMSIPFLAKATASQGGTPGGTPGGGSGTTGDGGPGSTSGGPRGTVGTPDGSSGGSRGTTTGIPGGPGGPGGKPDAASGAVTPATANVASGMVVPTTANVATGVNG